MSIPFPGGRRGSRRRRGVVPTRATRLTDVLTGDDPLLKDLERRVVVVDVYRFGGSVTPLSTDADALDLEPRDDRTDLSRALSEGIGGHRSA